MSKNCYKFNDTSIVDQAASYHNMSDAIKGKFNSFSLNANGYTDSFNNYNSYYNTFLTENTAINFSNLCGGIIDPQRVNLNYLKANKQLPFIEPNSILDNGIFKTAGISAVVTSKVKLSYDPSTNLVYKTIGNSTTKTSAKPIMVLYLQGPGGDGYASVNSKGFPTDTSYWYGGSGGGSGGFCALVIDLRQLDDVTISFPIGITLPEARTSSYFPSDEKAVKQGLILYNVERQICASVVFTYRDLSGSHAIRAMVGTGKNIDLLLLRNRYPSTNLGRVYYGSTLLNAGRTFLHPATKKPAIYVAAVRDGVSGGMGGHYTRVPYGDNGERQASLSVSMGHIVKNGSNIYIRNTMPAMSGGIASNARGIFSYSDNATIFEAGGGGASMFQPGANAVGALSTSDTINAWHNGYDGAGGAGAYLMKYKDRNETNYFGIGLGGNGLCRIYTESADGSTPYFL